MLTVAELSEYVRTADKLLNATERQDVIRYLAENPKGDGFCKLLYDRKNRCVVGVPLVGSYASEIIYGAALMFDNGELPYTQENVEMVSYCIDREFDVS